MCSLSGITVVSGLGRLAVRLKCKGYRDNVQQQPDLNKNQINPDSFFLQNQKSKSPDEASVKVKFEAAKRRFSGRISKRRKCKEQCKVQVIGLQDLPKQGPKLFHGRPVSQGHRQWTNNQR